MPWTDSAEDAISLDDDALIEACLGLDGQKTSPDPAKALPDWPPRTDQGVLIAIDPEIAAWFQAQSTTWRRDIGRVLRAWIVANKTSAQSPQEPGPSPDDAADGDA